MSTESLTAQNWPIAASTLSFTDVSQTGEPMHEAPTEEWARAFADIAHLGFTEVDLVDSWMRAGDVATNRYDDLLGAASGSGLTIVSISATRRSVVDDSRGDENLAYSHRTLEAAAALGVRTVSVGLHQELTEAQRSSLWFWTTTGHVDDPANWSLAVRRLRELGRHANEVGILLSLEMYEDTFLGTADSAVRLVEEIGMPNVGLNPDLGNLIRLHRPIECWQELVDKTMPYANYWHVKNYARDEDPVRGFFVAVPAPMEAGLINYRYAVQSAIANGFQGVICTENYGGDGLSMSATNRDYLRRRVLPQTSNYALGTSRVRQLSNL